jgi:hypothetical protein
MGTHLGDLDRVQVEEIDIEMIAVNEEEGRNSLLLLVACMSHHDGLDAKNCSASLSHGSSWKCHLYICLVPVVVYT